MRDLKSELLLKAQKDVHGAPQSIAPSPKWCGSCKHRYHDRGSIDGGTLGVCHRYNDNSPGLTAKPYDVLYGGASCPDYEEGEI